ncbi:MAG: hypothetical protein AB1796_10355 [Bacillota bacterium]
MIIYALIGPSGTGKSHHSALVAYQEGIEYIIDDGLFIGGNQILAGRSAKRENTKMAATKRAIFLDPEHAAQVREKIKEVQPQSILVLGTSGRMIAKIISRLELPPAQRIIHIEEISTPASIARAVEIREKENRHVIPIPTFALERDFPGYVIDSIRSFFRGGKSHTSDMYDMHQSEHSIVRPLYSTLGNYYISEHVLEQITIYETERMEGITHCNRVNVTYGRKGMIISIEVTLDFGSGNHFFPQLLKNLQFEVKNKLESMTGLQIFQVNVTARRLAAPR